MIQIIKTEIEGLLLLKPRLFQDERGLFYESFKEEDYIKAGIKEKFVQDNVSASHKNVLRGMHFQKDQGQLVSVIHGKIWDVVVDIRPDSNTFLQSFSIELSSDEPTQIYMPPGFAHGFCVLSDFVIMNYKCTQIYNPSKEGGLLWNDPKINIQWPQQNFIMSEKDKSYQVLGDKI